MNRFVTVRWSLHESVDTRPWERLVKRSKHVVVWDDGRGTSMWYTARRGPEERALRTKCNVALGAMPAEVSVS